MGVDLYLKNKKTGEIFNLGRAQNYFGYGFAPPPEINKYVVESMLQDATDTVENAVSDIFSDILYQPKDYSDAQRFKRDVEEKLDYLKDEAERLGKIRVLSELMEEENWELEQS